MTTESSSGEDSAIGVTVFFRDVSRAIDVMRSLGLTTRAGGLRVDDVTFLSGIDLVRLEVGKHVFQVPLDNVLLIHFTEE